jgi:hypothetical protein
MPSPPLEATPFQYSTGLDLGQAADYSAIVVIEWNDRLDPDGARGPDGEPVYLRHFGVRHLMRWPLRTSYPQIVAETRELFAGSPLRGSTLVIDSTGVGRAVTDMFRVADITAELKPMVITAGFTPTDETVPKIDLVGAVMAPLQDRRLTIAKELELAETLGKELAAFRVKVTPDRNEMFASWREKDHDDLVLATALAVWQASQQRRFDPDPFGLRYREPVPDTTAHVWNPNPLDPFTGRRRR